MVAVKAQIPSVVITRAVHLLAIFTFIYVGVEVTIGSKCLALISFHFISVRSL